MKFSESWLRERINPNIDSEVLYHRFTMAGLEIDAVEPVANDFTGVVIGQVITAEQHPDAQKLKLCKVSVGGEEDLQIICGDPKVSANMKVAVAQVGAKLSEELTIKKAKLRGIESYGMLCSNSELGLAETSNGILVLPEDAPVGTDIRHYLQLNDQSIEMELTPNRGDCLALEGIVRETSALCGVNYEKLDINPVAKQCDETFPVILEAGEDCPHYVGRVIRDINIDAKTPLWMQEKLRRSGIRSIDPVVDVTNYVMIELGQPMHAFDLETLHEKIIVRKAQAQEELVLLDGQQVKLDDDVLMIADAKGPLAMAGIMGGEHSGVSLQTKHLFLESAFFTPHLVAGKARRYGLHTDSSHRFERGVDTGLQITAVERATQLLLDIVGGTPGPIIEETVAAFMPKPKTVLLRQDRLMRVLGIEIPNDKVTAMLKHLGMLVNITTEGWQVDIPSYRFDIAIEEDLIEEVGRIYGYDQIPSHKITAKLQCNPVSEQQISLRKIRQLLIGRDYNEAITYSFVEPKIQSILFPNQQSQRLLNPISEELSEMRMSLLPGLINAFIYNKNRQQSRVRLFESGLRFIQNDNDELQQDPLISGICTGNAFPLQWGIKNRSIDFFDVKGDIEAIIALTGEADSFSFEPCQDSSLLHPGQSAHIMRKGKNIGFIGALHPQLAQKLDINGSIFVFELLFKDLEPAKLPEFATLSKYPAIRRDIAILVDEQIRVEKLSKAIRNSAGELLVDLKIFDVYQGEAAKTGQKSIALGLILQHSDRTLVDDEVIELQDRVVNTLSNEFNAVLRD